jgi:hypothetical protein
MRLQIMKVGSQLAQLPGMHGRGANYNEPFDCSIISHDGCLQIDINKCFAQDSEHHDMHSNSQERGLEQKENLIESKTILDQVRIYVIASKAI